MCNITSMLHVCIYIVYNDVYNDVNHLDNTEWFTRQVIRGVSNESENVSHHLKAVERERERGGGGGVHV